MVTILLPSQRLVKPLGDVIEPTNTDQIIPHIPSGPRTPFLPLTKNKMTTSGENRSLSDLFSPPQPSYLARMERMGVERIGLCGENRCQERWDWSAPVN